ncbi:calcium-translocating P-type ATPase, SERCA-type [Candidatus Woesearchaeota archaeon]|nr:calcium-translocating P-type ATPase, SERCA-type [Candidatus Woesearchaeota archaeon]
MDYYNKKLSEVYKALDSSEKGLTSSEAQKRLEQYGFNILKEKDKISPIKIFFSQFIDPVIWVLLGALVVSGLVGETKDVYLIGIILIINAILGFIQEYRAEKAIEALKKMASLKAVVLRDGKETEIDASNLVPGDIIVLREGEKIPADARLLQVTSLQTQEAALTGESLPIKKEMTDYETELSIGDRKNMVFSGTVITAGKGRAIIVKTGMQTEIGKIAEMIQQAEKEMTPLQKKLEELSKMLGILTLVICAVVFIVGVLRNQAVIELVRRLNIPGLVQNKEVLEMFITAVSLAVAAIPEGLPVVVTISLALGVQRMVKRHALIRKLPSVETLGCTTVICSDKTGTLTHNEMTIKKIFVDNEIITVEGSGYEPVGSFSNHTKDLELLLRIGALNNDAKLEKNDEEHRIIGDPTEGALIVSAAKAGLNSQILQNKHKRTDEIPFDSKRKMMTTIHHVHGKKIAYVKGAPDLILEKCSKILNQGKIEKLTSAKKKKIIEINEDFASDALRVLGFAYKELKNEKKQDWEKNLVFVGLQGMIDPPRKEVKDSIAKCKTAGIKVIMITGDFKGTAIAIARELGIEGRAITGEELHKIDLDREVDNIGIYARVNPEDKMKIVEALKRKGHIVAMTGDGVNDAPALKRSDLGIAMGIAGTDVAKEASDMILTDDNFTSIVNAVEEGRGIYDNILKFVQYLLSSNVGEILVIFMAIIFGWPVPLIPAQILWMNLLTDGLPAVALGIDPAEKNIMEKKPREANKSMFNPDFTFAIFFTGIIIASGTLFLFNLNKGTDLLKAQTIAFTTLVCFQFVRIYVVRSDYNLGLFSNKWLVGAVGLSLLLQLTVIYTPMNKWFETVPLSLMDWVYIVVVCSSILVFSFVFRLIKKTGKRTGMETKIQIQ